MGITKERINEAQTADYDTEHEALSALLAFLAAHGVDDTYEGRITIACWDWGIITAKPRWSARWERR